MIEIRNLCKNYGDRVIFNHLNLSFEENQITSLMAPSGYGKTTLLRILAHLENFEEGHIIGIEGKKMAYVFQEDRLLPWLTVRENIEYVLESWSHKEAYAPKVDAILDYVQLTSNQHQPVTTLSGGMKRRVALGRALAYEADVVLMDEPFKGLDERLKEAIIKWLLQIHKQKPFTLICVTHDIEEAKALGKVIEIQKERDK